MYKIRNSKSQKIKENYELNLQEYWKLVFGIMQKATNRTQHIESIYHEQLQELYKSRILIY